MCTPSWEPHYSRQLPSAKCQIEFTEELPIAIYVGLAHDDLQVSVHPGCAQGQGQVTDFGRQSPNRIVENKFFGSEILGEKDPQNYMPKFLFPYQAETFATIPPTDPTI